MPNRRRKKQLNPVSAIIAVVVILLAAVGYLYQHRDRQVASIPDAPVSIHFIDVGQGDSIYLRAGDKNVLIDAGDVEHKSAAKDYLTARGIKRLDVVIATHPHADHIGGMQTIVEDFEIGQIIMPKVPDALVPTTKTYANLLKAIQSKGLTITAAKPGDMVTLGDAQLHILGPLSDGSDLNNCSVTARLTYGDFAAFLGGDMEKAAEAELLASGFPVQSNLLKLSHHGSNTSSTQKFLDAVAADYYVVSVGTGNTYRHPHEEVLARLKGKQIYRTDRNGTVVFSTDGVHVAVETEKS